MLGKDLARALDGGSDANFSFKIGLKYQFTRKNPKDAKTIEKTVYKTLNTSKLYDCHTAKQLESIVNIDCSLDSSSN